jgi:hypothetical protein
MAAILQAHDGPLLGVGGPGSGLGAGRRARTSPRTQLPGFLLAKGVKGPFTSMVRVG